MSDNTGDPDVINAVGVHLGLGPCGDHLVTPLVNKHPPPVVREPLKAIAAALELNSRTALDRVDDDFDAGHG